jgi:CHAD domain-containing protein
MKSKSRFATQATFDPEVFVKLLALWCTPEVTIHPPRRRRFYDTFDARLYRAGLVLEAQERHFLLRRTERRKALIRQTIRKDPSFSRQIPSGRLRDAIKKPVGPRALLPVLNITAQRRIIHLRAADGSSYGQLSIDACFHEAGTTCGFLLESDIAVPALTAPPQLLVDIQACGFLESREDEFECLCRFCGIKPIMYDPRVHLKIDPQATAIHAVKEILLFVSEVIRKNLPGVLDDTDSEFLHDFRVAVRRTRAALGQLKGVLPEEERLRFREPFSKLGQLTNPMRDIDVFLSAIELYRWQLPDVFSTGLRYLRRRLLRDRRVELRKLCDGLQTDAVQALLQDWTAFLNRPEAADENPEAARQAAGRIIAKQFKAVLKANKNRIQENSSAQFHQLRIECKRLRYMLEFFASCLPATLTEKFLKRLRILQDILGAVQDSSIQQKYIAAQISGLRLRQPGSKLTAAALGGLITVIHNRQKEQMALFDKAFKRFAAGAFRNTLARINQELPVTIEDTIEAQPSNEENAGAVQQTTENQT